jgi:exonuclease III
MRVLTWNCRRATTSHSLWEVLETLDPDVALLQEVGALPDKRLVSYNARTAVPLTQSGSRQRFSTAVLSRWPIGKSVTLETPHTWVSALLEKFAGNVLSVEVHPRTGPLVIVVNVYSPAWPLDKAAYEGEQVFGIQLEQNREIWLTDIVTAGLRHSRLGENEACIVGGDFNSCVTFDSWPGGPRGNQEWLDRMSALGFIECLQKHQGQLTPTFRRPGRADPHCQIDKLFASRSLAARLSDCRVESAEFIYGHKLSDHLPVIADFKPLGVGLTSRCS